VKTNLKTIKIHGWLVSLVALVIGMGLFALASQASAQGMFKSDESSNGTVSSPVALMDYAVKAIAPAPIPVSLPDDGTLGTTMPTYNAVPEPASIAFLGIGGLLLVQYKRRKA